MTLAVFVALWRPLLAFAAVLLLTGLLGGLLASGAWPAWTFAVGVLFGLAGLASLAAAWTLRARAAIEDALDGDEPGPSDPTRPRTGPDQEP